MRVNKTDIKRVLVITLSNVGDIVLTTPVINTLSGEFPRSRIDVMVGPKGKEIFEKDPKITKVIVYDKHIPLLQKRRLSLKLRKLGYDMIVDLRNTIFPILLGAKYRTKTIQRFPEGIVHKRDTHLYRLSCFGIEQMKAPSYIHISKQDQDYVSRMIENNQVRSPIVAVSPGAKSHLKRWTEEGFLSLCNRLSQECGVSIVFIGCDEDMQIVRKISKDMKTKFYNFVDKTNVRQLAELLRRSSVLITNDSAPLHIACAVGTKVLALFGPTDPKKYGPTGEMDVVINKKLFCSPCEKAVCQYNYECMRSIHPDEVFQTAKELLEGYEIA